MIVEDKRHLQLCTHSRGNIQFMEYEGGDGVREFELNKKYSERHLEININIHYLNH